MFCAEAEPWVILLELVDLADILLLQKEFQALFYCFGPSSNFQPTGQECSTRHRVQGYEINHSYCPLGAHSSGSDYKDAGIQLYYKTVLSHSYHSKWLQSWWLDLGSLEVLEARHLKSRGLQGWCLMQNGKGFLFHPLWCYPRTCLIYTVVIPVCLRLHSGLLCVKAPSSFSILDLGPILNPG